MRVSLTMGIAGALGVCVIAEPGTGARASEADAGEPASRFYPHPVITEVLFNVPKGDRADANADGERQANADEFVELFNPHPKTINLRGYTITNRITAYDEETKRGVRFTFPAFKMEPGAVVVVFNGFDAHIPGPVGTTKRGPAKPNEHFGGAFVFTMDPGSRTCTFANTGDFVLLSDPRATPIDAVAWGDPEPAPPSETTRSVEVDKNPKGSVQRETADAEMRPHRLIDRHVCSPGRLPGAAESAEPDSSPEAGQGE